MNNVVTFSTRSNIPPVFRGTSSDPLTMSTKEIAELTGKLHKHVLRDARLMLIELHGEDRLPSFGHTIIRPNPKGGPGIPTPVYNLPKRETLILISGYCLDIRAVIIDRWQELEEQAQTPTIDLTNAAQLRMALLGYTERVLELEQQVALRDQCIAEQAPASPTPLKVRRTLC